MEIKAGERAHAARFLFFGPGEVSQRRLGELEMSLQRKVSRTFRNENRRRGVRVNSRVPVVIEWEADAGSTVREEVHTRIVGPYGCLVVAPRSLEPEKCVRLTNLATRQSNPAVIVWKGNERAEGWELGIELIDPEMDFWGLDL